MLRFRPEIVSLRIPNDLLLIASYTTVRGPKYTTNDAVVTVVSDIRITMSMPSPLPLHDNHDTTMSTTSTAT